MQVQANHVLLAWKEERVKAERRECSPATWLSG
jgi:hypothetical protein